MMSPYAMFYAIIFSKSKILLLIVATAELVSPYGLSGYTYLISFINCRIYDYS